LRNTKIKNEVKNAWRMTKRIIVKELLILFEITKAALRFLERANKKK